MIFSNIFLYVILFLVFAGLIFIILVGQNCPNFAVPQGYLFTLTNDPDVPLPDPNRKPINVLADQAKNII